MSKAYDEEKRFFEREAKRSESSARPTGSAAELEICRARFTRTVEVEQYLLDAANGKKPLPDATKCRELAIKIGVPPNALREPHADNETTETLERITELDAANTGLAMESHRLRELLREVSCMLHLWDGGLDEMDGKEFHEACDVWDDLLPRIDAELEKTDPPLPDEMRSNSYL